MRGRASRNRPAVCARPPLLEQWNALVREMVDRARATPSLQNGGAQRIVTSSGAYGSHHRSPSRPERRRQRLRMARRGAIVMRSATVQANLSATLIPGLNAPAWGVTGRMSDHGSPWLTPAYARSGGRRSFEAEQIALIRARRARLGR